MLVLDEVSRRYRSGEVEVRAVRGVSLTAAEGTLTAVMGPSGCGKSTLLTVAGGLQPPDSGAVTVAGVRIDQLSEAELYRHRRRHIGFVFQDYNLVRVLDAVENVALPAELDGVPRRKAHARAREALALVGLAGHAGRHPDSLSGGQQQRVALARAIASGGSLILADEPTGALDTESAARVLDALRDLVDAGATCVVVTHDDAVAARADRVLRMRDGALADAGAAA
ncbi:ABC transporter ATP-binding protein [Streptomyces albidoflavus]|uniref:ABC transporter ATP-binding protein n=1 Tax=Streptomyces albidoflavus TaxID=1886 RepID=UPI0033A5B32B